MASVVMHYSQSSRNKVDHQKNNDNDDDDADKMEM